MLMVVMLMVVMLMVVMLMVVMLMAMLVVIIQVFHHGMGASDAAAFVTVKIETPVIHTEFLQLASYAPGIDSQIDKGSQGHITGNPGETVKM